MRAWIEIPSVKAVLSVDEVALFMRAWIEINCQRNTDSNGSVALFMRAWIEIGHSKKHRYRHGSPSS